MLNEAIQLNRYALNAKEQKKETIIKATIDWVQLQLLPFLQSQAKKGLYCVHFDKIYSFVDDSYQFTSISCPKIGLDMSYITELLQSKGFYVEDNSTTYFVSWEDKYVY